MKLKILLCVIIISSLSVNIEVTSIQARAISTTNFIKLDGNYNSTINYPGRGTASDPYIIANLVFNQCNSEYLISIQNYNSYFELINIVVGCPTGNRISPLFFFNNMTHLTLESISIINDLNGPPSFYISNSTDITLNGILYPTDPISYIDVENVTGLSLSNSDTSLLIRNSKNIFIYNNSINFNWVKETDQPYFSLFLDENIRILNNTLIGNNNIISSPLLLISNASTGIIENNTVDSNFCYSLSGMKNITVTENQAISGGIVLAFSTNDTLSFNRVTDTADGIFVTYSNNCDFIENTISNTAIGFDIIHSDFLVFQNNHFQNITKEKYSFQDSSHYTIIPSNSLNATGWEMGIILVALFSIIKRKKKKLN